VSSSPDTPETADDVLYSLRAHTLIRDIPDFPKPGILFKDITPILADADALREVIGAMGDACQAYTPDLIVGIESRGFIFGVPVACALGLGFAPVRKVGKLPYQTVQAEYALEYGTAAVEIHTDAIQPGQRVVIVDDLLATGGTALAAASLVERLGGVVAGFCFLVELGFLGGRERLADREVTALITY
jgi:adenine phosphoribosyltransferase